jgi:hypothetical protein
MSRNAMGTKTCVLSFFTRGITYFDIFCPTLRGFARGLGCFTWGYKVKYGWKGKLFTRFNDPLALFLGLLLIATLILVPNVIQDGLLCFYICYNNCSTKTKLCVPYKRNM